MSNKEDNKNLLLQYAGFATQLCISLGVSLYLGIWLDKKINLSFPLLTWILPLIVLIVILTKLIKDTSSKR